MDKKKDITVDIGWIDPFDYMENENNYKNHPPSQKFLLERALEEVGFVTSVVVNKRTGKIIDGHLRIEKAREKRLEKIPAVILDCPEEEELKILSLLDYIAKKSVSKKEKFKNLVKKVNFLDNDLKREFDKIDNLFKEAVKTLTVSKKANFIILVFNHPTKYETAKEYFGVQPINVCGTVVNTILVDGDEWIEKL